VDPRLVRASSGLGMTLVRLGRVDESISAYDEALRLTPSNPRSTDVAWPSARRVISRDPTPIWRPRGDQPRVAEDYASYGVRPGERSREPGGQVDIVGGEGKVVRCKDDGTCWRCFEVKNAGRSN
jgi:hypothetical protein